MNTLLIKLSPAQVTGVPNNGQYLDPTSTSSFVQFPVPADGLTGIRSYIDAGGSWPASLVVTLEVQIGKGPWVSSTTTYNGEGLKASVDVTGLSGIRYRVTTVSASTNAVTIYANGVRA